MADDGCGPGCLPHRRGQRGDQAPVLVEGGIVLDQDEGVMDTLQARAELARVASAAEIEVGAAHTAEDGRPLSADVERAR